MLDKIILSTGLIKKGIFTMKFTKEHQIVKSWVSLVAGGTYDFKQVPNLFNLRKVVKEVLDELAAAETSVEAEQEG